MSHPDDLVLASFLQGSLEEPLRGEVTQHLATCFDCQRRLHVGSQSAEPTGELGSISAETRKAATLQRGSLVGRYVVIEVLGTGGMGEVYTAIDPELDRRVALKLVKAQDSRATDERQTRLLREAQAMAKLSHPNVVSIFDVGVVEGRVFLAMELVTGTTLTGWLAQANRSWRDVLEIFKQAGTGLSAAHHAGMIHRDFKPDNILIGHDGRVRVSDFGLARASSLEPSPHPAPHDTQPRPDGEITDQVYQSGSHNLLHTPMTQGVLGTPGYMAPEQLLGTATDEKSDQFSFCVSLYKALYREAPFRLGSLSEIVANITSGEARPEPEGTTVPAWVRRIVLRGLSAAPKARFASIDELIAALDKDPAKTRNKWLAIGGAVVASVAVVASGVGIARHQSQRCRGAQQRLATVWDEERQRAIQAGFVATGLPYAEDAWGRLKESLDRYAAEWVGQEIEACEATWVRGEQSDAVLSLRLRCLNDRLDELRALSNVLSTPDQTTVQRAARAPGSLTILSRCSDVAALERGTPLPKNDAAMKAVEALQVRLHAARSLFATGKAPEALPLLETVVAEAKSLDFAPIQAEAMLWLIKVRGPVGKFEGLRELVLETIRMAELSGDDSIRVQALLLLANLGVETGQPYDELMAYCRLAESAMSRIQDRAWHRLRLQNIRGNIAVERGHFDEALASYQEGLAFAATLPPAQQEALGEPVRLLVVNVGYVYTKQGRLLNALEQMAVATPLLIQRYGPHHPEAIIDAGNVAHLLLELNRLPEALAAFDHALELAVASIGARQVGGIRVRSGRANVLRALGRREEAERELREVVTLAEELGAKAALAEALGNLVQTLFEAGRAPEALALAERAIAADKALGLEPDPTRLTVLAGILRSQGRLAEAEQRAEAALKALEAQPNQHAASFEARLELATITWALKQPRAAARAHAEQAAAELSKVEGDTSERLKRVQAWLKTHPA